MQSLAKSAAHCGSLKSDGQGRKSSDALARAASHVFDADYVWGKDRQGRRA